jgi:hypothetical protein
LIAFVSGLLKSKFGCFCLDLVVGQHELAYSITVLQVLIFFAEIALVYFWVKWVGSDFVDLFFNTMLKMDLLNC